MPKNDKKKPAKAGAAPVDHKTSVAGALNAGQTKPTDAGRPSAAMGGKGASSKKGR